jgi:hypothetical protein
MESVNLKNIKSFQYRKGLVKPIQINFLLRFLKTKQNKPKHKVPKTEEKKGCIRLRIPHKTTVTNQTSDRKRKRKKKEQPDFNISFKDQNSLNRKNTDAGPSYCLVTEKILQEQNPESYVNSRTEKGKITHQILFVWSLGKHRKSTTKNKRKPQQKIHHKFHCSLYFPNNQAEKHKKTQNKCKNPENRKP